MPQDSLDNRINNHRIRHILLVFASPKTPKQAANELCIKRIKLKPFVDKQLLRCLNPESRKGKFYVVSKKARRCLNISCHEREDCRNWELIGWIIASPKQRLVIMRCIDERKLASEEIRMMATQFNANLTRPATKVALNELVQKHLVDSEIMERIRFYWITPHGQKIKDELAVIAPISSLVS